MILYWGAVWCPPCNQMKASLFKDPAFIAETEKFVPVYLDGDTAGAQQWGERFGISGYPTVIVLSPDGTEVTRISSATMASELPELLRVAGGRTTSVEALLAKAEEDTASLTADDWRHARRVRLAQRSQAFRRPRQGRRRCSTGSPSRARTRAAAALRAARAGGRRGERRRRQGPPDARAARRRRHGPGADACQSRRGHGEPAGADLRRRRAWSRRCRPARARTASQLADRGRRRDLCEREPVDDRAGRGAQHRRRAGRGRRHDPARGARQSARAGRLGRPHR